MGKLLGSKKTGGRKKGTPNKRSLSLVEALAANNVDPLQIILSEMQEVEGPDKIKISFELLPYIFPKRKPTEQTPFSITDYLDGLTLEEKRNLFLELEKRLGYKRKIEQMDLIQLIDLRGTIDEMISNSEEYLKVEQRLEAEY